MSTELASVVPMIGDKALRPGPRCPYCREEHQTCPVWECSACGKSFCQRWAAVWLKGEQSVPVHYVSDTAPLRVCGPVERSLDSNLPG